MTINKMYNAVIIKQRQSCVEEFARANASLDIWTCRKVKTTP